MANTTLTVKVNNQEKSINGEVQIKKWISDGIDIEAVAFAEKFGEQIADTKTGKLSTSQIRNFFGEVVRLKAKNVFEDSIDKNFKSEIEPSFILLKPKLAYAAQRHKVQGLIDLKAILTAGIDCVLSENDNIKKQKRFNNFVDLFEAILAYHRAAGGK